VSFSSLSSRKRGFVRKVLSLEGKGAASNDHSIRRGKKDANLKEREAAFLSLLQVGKGDGGSRRKYSGKRVHILSGRRNGRGTGGGKGSAF